MNNNWKIAKLIDVADFQNGHAFYTHGYSDSGYIAIDLFNVDESGRLRLSKRDKHVSTDIVNKYKKFILNKGDLVIIMTDMTQTLGILGKCAFIDSDNKYVLNQRIGRIVPNENLVDPYYLYLYINSLAFRKPLHQLAKGAVQKYVNTGDIKNNLINLPSMQYQKRISGFIKDYDDLIVNNEKRIALLEEIAQRLYVEWFIHFKFPGHEKIKMVDSELGKIPEGWKVLPFPELVAIQRGKSYRSIDLSDDEGLEFVNLKCIERNGGFRRDGLKKYTGDYKDGHVVNDGDIVMAVTDMTQARDLVGRVALIPKLKTEGVISMDLVKIIPKKIDSIYLYSYLRYSSIPHRLKNMANGANVLHLRPDKIESQSILLPPSETIDKYSSVASELIKLMDNLEEKNEILSKTRNLLLPRMVSGDLEI